MKAETNENFSSVVVKKFGISSRYARTLRWFGQMWWQYKKIGYLGISLSKIYSYKNQLESLFKNHPGLANEWKITENQPQIRLSSTNPFLNDITQTMDISG